MTWSDPDGLLVKSNTIATTMTYAMCVDSVLPIPAGTASGTEIDLPLAGITQGLTGLRLQNMSGQELGMAYGGNFSWSLPPGGSIVLAFSTPVSSSGRAITVANTIRFFTTAVQPSPSPGGVNYWFMGY